MARRKRHSINNYMFSTVPKISVPRSSFDRPHGFTATIEPDYLYPIYCDIAYPGDTFEIPFNSFCRLNSAPVVPIMDNLYISYEFFAVPVRLVWEHWVNFNGERDLVDESPEYTVPQILSGTDGFAFNSIFDYLGIRPNTPNLSVSALPMRAYNKIYNYWYRDENLINPISDNMSDTGDTPDMYPLRKRAKIHDYFTSALPFPQKGDPVSIPFTGDAPVIGDGSALGLNFNAKTTNGFQLMSGPTASSTAGGDVFHSTDTGGAFGNAINPLGVSTNPDRSGLIAKLSSVAATTINQLRLAFATQRVLEKDARGGTRYPEMILSHFGVVSPDARQQRPELLFSASHPLFVNPVVQNSSTTTTSAQGNVAAYVVGGSSQTGVKKSFTEHTIVMGLACVRSDNRYQYGIPRWMSYKTRFDFYLPSFAYLGEQAILNKEIFAQGNSSDDEVFGYQERWSEMRYYPSVIAGTLRSDHPQSLDIWHLAQSFDKLPILNQEFIESGVPLDRVLSVTNEPAFILDINFQDRSSRPLPINSVPGLIDHY